MKVKLPRDKDGLNWLETDKQFVDQEGNIRTLSALVYIVQDNVDSKSESVNYELPLRHYLISKIEQRQCTL